MKCPIFQQIHGTIIHETLHALGVDHQHTRYDRNSHLQIHYENIDPQLLDNFAAGDTNALSSYGVKYDYYSAFALGVAWSVILHNMWALFIAGVMHYSAYVRGLRCRVHSINFV